MFRIFFFLVAILWVVPTWAEDGASGDKDPSSAADAWNTDGGNTGTQPGSDPAPVPSGPDKAQPPADDSPWSRPTYETAPRQSTPSSAASLTPEERSILDRGLYDGGEIYGGAALGFFVGYGTGHLVQGRYTETGWIATAGTVAGVAVVFNAVKRCAESDAAEGSSDGSCSVGGILTGVLIVAGVKVWEVIDLVSTPRRHNQKYRALKRRQFTGILPITDGERHGFALTMTF